MKGIETQDVPEALEKRLGRSDHCPAMKGIETRQRLKLVLEATGEATTAPQ